MTRLALLTGTGDVAGAALDAVQSGEFGQDFISFSMIDGAADAGQYVDIGAPEVLIDCLRSAKASTLCVVGGVDLPSERRSGIVQYLLQKHGGSFDASDMGLELALMMIAKDAQVKLVGVHELLPQLLAGSGAIVGDVPAAAMNDIESLVRTARAIARTDIGQSTIFHGSRPLATEDALGTDSLIERAGVIREALNLPSGSLTLVKVAKPQQSGVGDLPTIGPITIENCAKAGIGQLIVEADKCLIAKREEFIQMASKTNINVLGWG